MSLLVSRLRDLLRVPFIWESSDGPEVIQSEGGAQCTSGSSEVVAVVKIEVPSVGSYHAPGAMLFLPRPRVIVGWACPVRGGAFTFSLQFVGEV